jgi:hypothetical protein
MRQACTGFQSEYTSVLYVGLSTSLTRHFWTVTVSSFSNGITELSVTTLFTNTSYTGLFNIIVGVSVAYKRKPRQ